MTELFESKTFKISLISTALTGLIAIALLWLTPDIGYMEAIGVAKGITVGLDAKIFQQAMADKGKEAAKIENEAA